MDLRIAGDVAVVAGGARGLGLAIAGGFAEEGSTVAVIDRDPAAPTVVEQLVGAQAGFLASPRARIVTGQTSNVDGGFVMHW